MAYGNMNRGPVRQGEVAEGIYEDPSELTRSLHGSFELKELSTSNYDLSKSQPDEWPVYATAGEAKI